VVTLATMALFRGLALGISQGQPVSQLPPGFAGLGQGSLGGAPVQLWVWMAVVGLAGLVTTRLVWGRWVRALGDNELAARHAAVPVGRVQICLYALSGLSSAVAGLIFCARVSTARADAGVGFELEVITAVVLGGTRITGGRGSVSGTLLGVILIGTIRNGLNLLGLASVWQAMVAGAVLVGTAVVNERIALHREMSSA
jgi:rhamnose transport system permease protein